MPIGAAIADAGGRVVARGRNRIYEAAAEAGQLHGHTLAHAEINALLALDDRRHDRRACALYSTTEPCPLCFGALYVAGLRELRYAARDPFAGSTDLLGTTPYLRRKPLSIIRPERADLEAVIVAWHVEFSLALDRGRAERLLEVWEPILPAGLRLGRALFQADRLRELRAVGATAARVVDELVTRL